MKEVIISIGGNTPDAAQNVDNTLHWLSQGADGSLFNTLISSTYTTPENSGRYPDYTNAVAIAQTDKPFDSLNRKFKLREAEIGRTPSSKQSGLVPIDIDIIAYDGEIKRPHEFNRIYITTGLNEINDRHTHA